MKDDVFMQYPVVWRHPSGRFIITYDKGKKTYRAYVLIGVWSRFMTSKSLEKMRAKIEDLVTILKEG